MDLQVSPYYHSFLTVPQSYHSKVTPPVGAWHAQKIAEAALLYVFRLALAASHLQMLDLYYGVS